jgi:hypothetical protein
MRARVLFAEMVAVSTVIIAGPASAKALVAEANITGPGLGGGIRIEAPDADGLWESGIDVAGGLDDARADSVEELGLSPGDRGPRYLVTYRFFGDDLIRQELYPYAKGGPVTYTPPGQKVTAGVSMQITAGWYQGSRGFFRYLVDHGLPERHAVASISNSEAARDTGPPPETWTVPWASIFVVLVVLAALSLAVLAVRRRVSRWVGRPAKRLRHFRGGHSLARSLSIRANRRADRAGQAHDPPPETTCRRVRGDAGHGPLLVADNLAAKSSARSRPRTSPPTQMHGPRGVHLHGDRLLVRVR